MPLADEVIEVVDRLLSGNRTGVDGVKVWNEILRANPALSVSADRRTQFVAALEHLAAAGAIRLPGKDPAKWDRSAPPAIPLRFHRVRPQLPAAVSTSTISWRSELAFVAQLRGLRPQSLQELKRIQTFLQERDKWPPVPIKERSYQLFGDEKRLDTILASEIGQHLPFATLKVFVPRLVPLHDLISDSTAPDVIVLENESAFDSFNRWNAIHRQFAMVVYGRGLEASKYADFLSMMASQLSGRIFYFGDLDGHGVQIARQLDVDLRRIGGPTLIPLISGYEALLRETPRPDLAEPSERVWREASLWLPGDIRSRAMAMFASGHRVAQEAFGWNALSQINRL
jgi:hypothetical protein